MQRNKSRFYGYLIPTCQHKEDWLIILPDLRRILGLDEVQFLFRVFLEHVFEKLIQTWRVLHNAIRRAAFVENRSRRVI